MRIAYLLDEPLPSTETSSEQAINNIAGMTRAGAEVVLFLPRHVTRAPATAEDIYAYYGVAPTFEVAHLRSAFPSHRAIEKVAHGLRSSLARSIREFDLVYTRNIPTLLGSLAAGHRVIYETHRPWPTQYKLTTPVFRAAMRRPNFLGAVVHSDHAKASYVDIGVAPERVEVFHNGFEPARMEPRLPRDAALAMLGLPPHRKVVTYTGRVTVAKGLGMVIDLAHRMPDVLFLLVGSEGEGEIERIARGVENVRLFPWQAFADVPKFLYASDVLMIPPTLGPLQSTTVLPMKLFLYLAAGRTLFGPQAPDTEGLLVHDENAWLVRPDDHDAAVAGLQHVLASAPLQERLVAGALRTAADYTWEARGHKLLRFIDERLAAARQR